MPCDVPSVTTCQTPRARNIRIWNKPPMDRVASRRRFLKPLVLNQELGDDRDVKAMPLVRLVGIVEGRDHW